MKLQYKAAGLMIFIGGTILFLLIVFYSMQNRKIVLQKELQNIKNISKEIARQMDCHLKAKAKIASTLSSAPIIRAALLKNNSKFDVLSEADLKDEIGTLNRQWIKTKDSSDPFIQKHLTNQVAEFLKLQQIILPGLYGEIFLTNRHGMMIASTGKLTTLAHSHKYWWKASYHEGEGRVFFDDRGFDASVKGYVIGVVVPVKNENEIIGILKCNINIMGPLTDIIQEHRGSLYHHKVRIVRTKGLIVAENGKTPLSNSLHENLIQYLQTRKIEADFVEKNGQKELVAFSPIRITMGSEKFGFGGSYESIDHIKGNQGEGWHVVISLDEEIAIKDADETTRQLIMMGMVFTVIMSLIALFLGKWIANPLIKLADTSQKLGMGYLGTRVHVVAKDEIGILGNAFNNMAKNLENTVTSRDNLVQEIERRKKAEEQIKTSLKEKETLLYEIHHRVKNNLTVVSSLLSLQSRSIDDKRLKEALMDSQNRVHSMSLIHETLYQSENLASIDLKTYLSKIVQAVSQNYSKGSTVGLKIEAENIMIGVKHASPVGLIVNELITNSFKYAFPGNREGEIKISLLKTAQDQIELNYADNGIGIPKDFDWQDTKSMGLQLVKLLAEGQLDGSIELNRDQGTQFIIRFMLKDIS